MGSMGRHARGTACLNPDDCSGGCRRRAAGWGRDGIPAGCRATASAGCSNGAAPEGERSAVHRSWAARAPRSENAGAPGETGRSGRGCCCMSHHMIRGSRGRHRSRMVGMRLRSRQA